MAPKPLSEVHEQGEGVSDLRERDAALAPMIREVATARMCWHCATGSWSRPLWSLAVMVTSVAWPRIVRVSGTICMTLGERARMRCAVTVMAACSQRASARVPPR